MDLLESLIDVYAETQFREDANVLGRDEAKKRLKKSIVDEIKDGYAREIREQVKTELEEERTRQQQLERVEQVKSIIIESILIATVVGLMVNQVTDVITYIKNGDWNSIAVCITVFLLIIMLAALFVYIKCAYINRIVSFFKEYSKKKGR